MSIEYINVEELTEKRTPYELWNWLIQKVNQICSTKEGEKAFRLQKGTFLKKLVEEVTPLAIFGKHKFGDTKQVFLQPFIGNQPFDAKVIDKRTEPAFETYVEITQAHEGEDAYLRRCELLKKGIVYSYATVIKKGKGKHRSVSIPPEATSVEERVENELGRILIGAQKKEHIDYPANTSLIIFFEDATPFQEVINNEKLDSFVNENIVNLDLRFSTLYLVGQLEYVFREYPINLQD